MGKDDAAPPTTLRLEGEDFGWMDSDPVELTWRGATLDIEMEGTLPASDYNIDGTFTCRLSRADVERLRAWLTEMLS